MQGALCLVKHQISLLWIKLRNYFSVKCTNNFLSKSGTWMNQLGRQRANLPEGKNYKWTLYFKCMIDFFTTSLAKTAHSRKESFALRIPFTNPKRFLFQRATFAICKALFVYISRCCSTESREIRGSNFCRKSCFVSTIL